MRPAAFRLSAAVLALLVLTGPLTTSVVRADDTWTGGGGGLWNDASNWSNGVPVSNFGTLTFATSTNSPSNDNISSLSGNKLLMTTTGSFEIDGTGAISLFDNGGTQSKIENNSGGGASGAFTLNNANIYFAATAGAAWGEINAVTGDVIFGSANTLTVNASQVAGIRMFGAGHNTTFNGTVSAGSKYFAETGTGDVMNIGGAFASGDIYVMNNGVLNLNAGGSYTASGVTGVRLGGDFGTTGSQNLAQSGTFNLTVATGGQSFAGVINSVAGNTSGTLAVNSQNTSGTNTLSGHIALDSNLAINQSSGGTLTISNAHTGTTTTGIDTKAQTLTLGGAGTINITGDVYASTGSGSVAMSGTGTDTLGGATDNTAIGAIVNSGTLVLGKTSSGAVHAVGTGLTINNTGTAKLGGSGGDQIYNNAAVAVNTGGTFDLAGFSESIDGLTGGGAITNSSTTAVSTLTIGANNATSTFTGTLTNGGSFGTVLSKSGTGAFTYGGNGISTLAKGSVNVTAGTFNFGVAATDAPTLTTTTFASGNVAVDISGGAFNMVNGTLNAGSAIYGLVLEGTQTYTQTGGTVNANTIDLANGGGNSTVNVSAGSLTATAATNDAFDMAVRGTSTVNLSGTGAITTPVLNMSTNQISQGTPTTTFNLNGGTLTVGTIIKGTSTTAVSQTFNFNGGTLKSSANSPTFMTGLTNAFVKSNGAKIDTNGFSDTIGQNLLTDAVSTSGGLTLNDTAVTKGTLTLSGTNTYTGATTITAGTLVGTNKQAFGSGANATGQLNLSGATSTLSLLNDGGTGTVTGQTIIYGGAATSNTGYNLTAASGTINVGNNGNAGSTNNTIQLGAFSFGGGSNTVNITSANGYGLKFNGSLSTPAANDIKLFNTATPVEFTGGLTAGAGKQALFTGTGVTTIDGNLNTTASGTGFTLNVGLSSVSPGPGNLVVKGTSVDVISANVYGGALTIYNPLVAPTGTGGNAPITLAQASASFTTATLNLRNDADTSFGSAITATSAANNVFTVDQATAGNTGHTLTLGTLNTNQTVTLNNGNGYNLAFGAVSSAGSPTFTNNMTNGTTTLASFTDSAASAQTLTFNGTSSTANTSVGAIGQNTTNALAVTKAGSGTLTLTGASTYTGNTTISAGTLTVGNGTTGSITPQTGAGTTTSVSSVIVGNSTTTAVLNINSGAGVTNTVNNINVGMGAGASALNIASGTLTSNGTDSDGTDGVFGAGGYGALNVSGGALNISRLYFGFTTSNQVGVGNISGGTVTTNGVYPIILSRGGGAGNVGDLTVSGGTLNAKTGQGLNIGFNAAGRAELNVTGGLVDTTGAATRLLAGTGGVSIANLNGGTLQTNGFTPSTTGTNLLNFNGGTLKAGAAGTLVPAITGTAGAGSNAYVNGAFGGFAGGAVFDTNGQSVTVAANLLAPTGSGVSSIAVTGGTGYVGAPYVAITGGGGTGATAIANLDASGNLTGITVTNPGVGYTSAPTVTLTGGGGTGAVFGAVGTAANTSGGLTKNGAGTLTLTGANTYTGPTAVTAGALIVNGNQSAAAGAVTVNSGATLGGTGTVGGATTITGTITGGTVGTVGTLNLTSALIVNGNYVADVLSGTGSDKLVIASSLNSNGGTLTLQGTVDNVTKYVLATYNSLVGQFTNVVNPFSAKYQLVYTGNATTAGELDLVLVPEPGTWLGGLLLAGAFGYSRRRLVGKRRAARGV